MSQVPRTALIPKSNQWLLPFPFDLPVSFVFLIITKKIRITDAALFVPSPQESTLFLLSHLILLKLQWLRLYIHFYRWGQVIMNDDVWPPGRQAKASKTTMFWIQIFQAPKHGLRATVLTWLPNFRVVSMLVSQGSAGPQVRSLPLRIQLLLFSRNSFPFSKLLALFLLNTCFSTLFLPFSTQVY